MLVRRSIILMTILIAVSSYLLTAQAAPNPQINYQGKLTDNTGSAVTDGTYNIAFNLYTQADAIVWSSTTTVPVVSGLFSYLLGSSTSLMSVDFNQPLYLSVNIGGTSTPAWDGEMTPRKILGTVPSAFEAIQFDGLATTSFLRNDQADTANNLLTFLGGASTSELIISGQATTSDIYVNGSLGINTNTPATDLEVIGSASTTNLIVAATATITNLAIGGDLINNLAGTGLTVTGNALTATLGTDITAGEIADGDHGVITYSSGVATFDNNVVTPDAILSTGQTDEYCLTYETGDTFQWQECATGGTGGGGLQSIQVFDTAGTSTWTKPAGIDAVRVIVTGGGGGGGKGGSSDTGGHGGGGTGATSIEFIDVSATSSVWLEVGSGGAGGIGDNTDGSQGATSSFGTYANVSGGGGGSATVGFYGGYGGFGGVLPVTGDINLAGGDGGTGGGIASGIVAGTGGAGGSSYWGGGGRGGDWDGDGQDAVVPGSGGGGAGGESANPDPGAGASGIIVVYEYQTSGLATGTIETGTQGQLAFFEGSGNTLTGTSSLFLDTNGYLGIGTTSPFSRLTVAGDITPDANLTYDLGSSTRRWSNLWAETLNVGTSTWSIFNGTDGRLAFSNSAEQAGTEALSILSNGNVGIGTTSPYAKFSVAGNIVASSFVATTTATSTLSTLELTGAFYDTNGNAGADGYVLQSTVSGVQWVATSSLGISSGSGGGSGGGGLQSIQVFDTAGTSTWTKPAGIDAVRVIVTGGGGGGGGADTDSNGAGGGGAGATAIEFIDVSATSSIFISVGSGGGGGSTSAGNGSAGGSTAFSTFAVAGGGSGGEGVTFPASRVGSGGAGGTVSTSGDIDLEGGDGDPGSVVYPGNDSHGGTGGASYWGGGGEGGDLDGSGSTGLAPGSGGGGAAEDDAAGQAGGTGADGIIVIYEYQTQGLATGTIETGTQGQLAFFEGTGNTLTGTSSLFLDTNGYLGVGTTSPFSRLTVAGDITPDANLTYDLGSSTRRWSNLWVDTLNVGTSTWSIFNGTDGRLAFSNAAEQAGTEALSILSNGNVGIGTTSPNAKLSIAGNVIASSFISTSTATSSFTTLGVIGDLYDAFGSAGAPGQVLQSTASGIQWVSTSSLNISGGGSGSGQGLQSVQVFDTAGTSTWTKPAGVDSVMVYVTGAGGGGGGAYIPAGANPHSAGGGGGAGATAIEFIDVSATSSIFISVGSGGGGGSTSGGNGSAGESTVFSTYAVAGGGSGGTGNAIYRGAGAGGNGGTVSVSGDIDIAGGAGTVGGGSIYSKHAAGTGGASYWGGGGRGGDTDEAGVAGAAYGSGGGGAAEDDTSGQPGGAGASGIVVVYEYTSNGGADLAELYPTTDLTIGAGDIVLFSTDGIEIAKAVENTNKALAGVISTDPGITLTDHSEGENAEPVALAGRIPTKVNLEGGPIFPGDRIAPSSVPGVGRKANQFEPSVGTAITAFTDAEDTDIGLVTVFVDLQEGFNTTYLTDVLFNQASTTLNHSTTSSTTTTAILTEFIPTNPTDTIWSRLYSLAVNFVDGVLAVVGIETEAITATDITSTKLETSELCVDDVCVNADDLRALLGQSDNDISTGSPVENEPTEVIEDTELEPEPEDTDTSNPTDPPTSTPPLPEDIALEPVTASTSKASSTETQTEPTVAEEPSEDDSSEPEEIIEVTEPTPEEEPAPLPATEVPEGVIEETFEEETEPTPPPPDNTEETIESKPLDLAA